MSARAKRAVTDLRRRPTPTAPEPLPTPLAEHESLVEQYAAMAHAFEPRAVDSALRLLDVVIAGAAAAVTAPMSLLIAVLVKLTSPRGPVLYRGWRVGRGGHLFQMLKFRTLAPDAEQRLGPFLGPELTQLTQNEVTPLGRVLRASKLDELPQLYNVLRGDMSLVGPRPIRPRFFEELAGELPAYWQRLVVRPGLTGFAQVRRGYETSMAEKLAHDLEWIADRSVRLYLRTLAVTTWRVLGQFVRGLAGHGG